MLLRRKIKKIGFYTQIANLLVDINVITSALLNHMILKIMLDKKSE